MELTLKQSLQLYQIILLVCLMPFVTPPMALCAGMVLSILGIRRPDISKHTSKVLQTSIVLMGFGMSMQQVLSASKSGFMETAISVCAVMLIGVLLGRLLNIGRNTSLLIASGTAICGGSAIAAVSTALQSKDSENSIALIVVFVLNSIALFVFPVIGWQMGLSQTEFGNWAAIAIHDTSSVVGAGATYGDTALQVATTVKLIRALWIVPLTLLIALMNRGKGQGRIVFPWFILFFVAAIVLAYVLPQYQTTFTHLNWLGKRGMVIALFLIGSNISFADIKQSGIRSFVLGVGLWLIIAVGSLLLLRI